MLKNASLIEKWYRKQLREETLDFARNLRIFEALYEEARTLGVLPLRNPMEGLETKILVAKVVNVSGTAGKDRPGAR